MLRQPRERCHLWNSVGCETMWVSSQHGLVFLPSSSPKKALYSNSKLYWKQNAAMMDGRQWPPDLLWFEFTLKYNIQLNNDVFFQLQRPMSNTELLQSSLPSSAAHRQQRCLTPLRSESAVSRYALRKEHNEHKENDRSQVQQCKHQSPRHWGWRIMSFNLG